MLTKTAGVLLLVVLCCIHHTDSQSQSCSWWSTCHGKRGLALRRELEKSAPTLSFDVWSAQCGQIDAIDYTCFRIIIGQKDTGTTRAAFYSADTDRDEYISEKEFDESPFLSRGDFEHI